MNKRLLEQKIITLRAKKKILNLEKSINKGSFKDIDFINIARWGRDVSNEITDIVDDKNSIVTGEDWVNNLSDLPTASKHTGKIIYVLNFGVGGSPWISNGTIWVPATGRITVASFHEPLVLGGTVTVDQIMRQAMLPTAPPIGGNVMRIGDLLRITNDCRKVGAVNGYTRGIKIGITGTVTDATSEVFGSSGTGNNSSVERHYYLRVSNTVVRKLGMFGSISIQGISTGASGGSVTMASSVDNNSLFFSFVAKMDGGTDTFTNRTFMAEFFPCGASV